jgi:hypothetical protein
MKVVYIVLNFFLLLVLSNCNEKQTRVNACMRISKARMAQDGVNYI